MSDKRNAKKERKHIPKTLKELVWKTYIGADHGKSWCLICTNKEITAFDFECAHVKADVHGGQPILENLRPTCRSCNSSMGSINMKEFCMISFPNAPMLKTFNEAKSESLLGQLVDVILTDLAKTDTSTEIKTVSKTTRIATHTALAQNLNPNVYNAIVRTLKLPRNEKLEIVYIHSDNFDENFNISTDIIVGLTNLRIFKIQSGNSGHQFISNIVSVSHKKNGLFSWDKLVCNLKSKEVDTYGIYHSSVCGYLCDYMKHRINK